MTMPSLFLSHGSPTLPLTDTPARSFLSQLGGMLARPKAILVISAHWETSVPTINAVDRNETIHDFRGFPRPLYELRYPAPGSPAVAARIADLLRGSGIDCRIDPQPWPRSRRLGAAIADVSAGRHSRLAAFGAAAPGDRAPSSHGARFGAAAAGGRADHRQRQHDPRSVGIPRPRIRTIRRLTGSTPSPTGSIPR